MRFHAAGIAVMRSHARVAHRPRHQGLTSVYQGPVCQLAFRRLDRTAKVPVRRTKTDTASDLATGLFCPKPKFSADRHLDVETAQLGLSNAAHKLMHLRAVGEKKVTP